jgi:tRNA dimethylallyltransferase
MRRMIRERSSSTMTARSAPLPDGASDRDLCHILRSQLQSGVPPRLVVIVGPTGAGKTKLSLELATKLGGEVVSVDSQQVYIGMDIGTGKVSAQERARVPHHLLDVVRPDEEMTMARYIELADRAIADVAARGRVPIICGGTGLYVRGLLLGLFEGPPEDKGLRKELVALGAERLHAELSRVDPESATRIDRNDVKRMVRALEVYRLTGETMSAHQARHDHKTMPRRYEAKLVGLSPEREQLYAAIDARVDEMIAAGLEREVAALREAGYLPPLRSQHAIGYAELHDVAAGTVERGRAIELIKRNSRHYARRQLSWYRPDQTITWYPSAADVDLAELERYLAKL